MLISNPGVQKLIELQPFKMGIKDLSQDSLDKAKDTAIYSLGLNPDQDKKQALLRCIVAQMAEQKVADHIQGWVNHGIEDVQDPITFAYDVLAPVEYSGLRIEVKTHQSDAKWISVSTGANGKYAVQNQNDRGVNIGPFLDHQISDLIIFIDTKKINGKYLFTPKLLCDRMGLMECVKKSNFKGYYINPPFKTENLVHKYC